MMRPGARPRRVGIIGYGAVGRFLAAALLAQPQARAMAELAFVWNRSEARLRADQARLPQEYWLTGEDVATAVDHWRSSGKGVDLLVEVSHPMIIQKFGAALLEHADLLVGSPAAFADRTTERELRYRALTNAAGHACYIPNGAAWGVADISRMDSLGTLSALRISMSFHPCAFRDLGQPLRSRLDAFLQTAAGEDEAILYEGPVRELCTLAPNNVNTMACCCLAGQTVGFDRAIGQLKVGRNLEAHVLEIDIAGAAGFRVAVRRSNPARAREVTGTATYAGFLASLLQAGGRSNGVHFC